MNGHDPFESKWWIDRLVAITASHKRTKALIRGAQIHAAYMEHDDAKENVTAQLIELERWVYGQYAGIPEGARFCAYCDEKHEDRCALNMLVATAETVCTCSARPGKRLGEA